MSVTPGGCNVQCVPKREHKNERKKKIMAVATLSQTKLSDISSRLVEGKTKKLAGSTVAMQLPDSLVISYHDNPIVVAQKDVVLLTNCNWTTYTTAGRLSQIAYSNFGGSVYIYKGDMFYRDRDSHDTIMSPWVEIDPNTGKVTDSARTVAHGGWSNFDTWCAVSGLDNVEWLYNASRSVRNLADLRSLIKENKRELEYKSLANVNVREIFKAIRSEAI